ncbi:MAG: BspA family leucine-rich repeat surface protein [Gammaproteobacteria bacterium]|nr:BspA family leucine-rich repeat surface protein [Gammaproteobacteria bacterium]
MLSKTLEYKKQLLPLLLISSLTLLTACGGSSGSSARAPSLTVATDLVYTVDQGIIPFQFINEGGGSLTNCSASLPSGLIIDVSYDETTCIISGVPIEITPTTEYVITAVNSAGESTIRQNISIVPHAPDLITYPSQTFVVDKPVFIEFTNFGGGYLTSCEAPVLPAGLEVAVSENQGSCTISGVPTEERSMESYIVTAVNAGGSSAASINIAVKIEKAFITTWKTDNPGASESNQITIHAFPALGDAEDFRTNYTVDWGDGSIDSNLILDITHTYEQPGIYTVKITGSYAFLFYVYESDAEKLLTVEQWGNQQWPAMRQTFFGAKNLVINATDKPDLSNVKIMTGMFAGATNFNSDISDWDVSNVEDMGIMFLDARAFNQDIGGWNVSSVKNMRHMFSHADNFNQDISNWDVSSVETMLGMFRSTLYFDQNISSWNVSSVTDMSRMFQNAKAFDQNIGSWNITSVANKDSMFSGAVLTSDNYNKILEGWSEQNVQQGVNFDAGMAMASDDYLDTKEHLKTNFNWTIYDGDEPNNRPPSILVPYGSPTNYRVGVEIHPFRFLNDGFGMLTECSSDLSLPTGLSITISADLSTCEISGTPTEESSTRYYQIFATNEFGVDVTGIEIGVETN